MFSFVGIQDSAGINIVNIYGNKIVSELGYEYNMNKSFSENLLNIDRNKTGEFGVFNG